MAKRTTPVATVHRVLRWHDGTEYELREGEPVDAPQEVLEFLRRAGYVEEQPGREGGEG